MSGTFQKKTLFAIGLRGPNLRASGVKRTPPEEMSRTSFTKTLISMFPFHTEGDTLARYYVQD